MLINPKFSYIHFHVILIFHFLVVKSYLDKVSRIENLHIRFFVHLKTCLVTRSSNSIFLWLRMPFGTRVYTTMYLHVSPSMELTLSRWGGLSTKKFQSASARRAQLSLAAKTVKPTDLLNHNVKTWVNTD